MPFVRKESKPIRVEIGDDEDGIVLFIKPVRAERLLSVMEEHRSDLGELLEASEKGKEEKRAAVGFPRLGLLREMKGILLDAACGWENVVDESGSPVPFSREELEGLIEQDVEMYIRVISAVFGLLAGKRGFGEAEKN